MYMMYTCYTHTINGDEQIQNRQKGQANCTTPQSWQNRADKAFANRNTHPKNSGNMTMLNC